MWDSTSIAFVDSGTDLATLLPTDGVWGGDEYVYNDDARTSGRKFRKTKRRPALVYATPGSTDGLDRLAFDDDLGLALSDDLKPVLED